MATTEKDIKEKKPEEKNLKAELKKDRKKLILYSEIMKPKFKEGLE
jgi:hypothetical protein